MRRFNAVPLTVFVFLAVLLVMSVSDDSDAAVSDNVKVYIEMEDGSYEMTVVDGVNKMEDAVNQAAEDLGVGEIEMLSSGRGIKSVGGRVPAADHYWVVHQWLPHSPDESIAIPGWGEVTLDGESDGYLRTGVSLCLHIATIDYENADARYTVPDFKPVSEGYVFLRFYINYNDPNPFVQEAFDEETRLAGFWLKGTGSNLGEVLVNAIRNNDFEIEYYVGQDGHGNNLQYWIDSLFGMGDVEVDDGIWAYWIQLCFIDNEWSYNGWTMGYYDPAVYNYIMLVYSTSAAEGEITYDIGEEPDPAEAEFSTISRYNTVSFYVDGELFSEQTVEWGKTVDLRQVKTPSKEGYLFQGWTGCDGLIYSDTRADASFVKATTTCSVTYMGDDGKTVIATESVRPGEPATYSNVPGKAGNAQYTYIFKGWSSSKDVYVPADLSCIGSDVIVYAFFDSVVNQYTVTFMFKGNVYSTCTVDYGSPAVIPEAPSKGSTAQYTYTFKGWSSTYSTYNKANLGSVTKDTTVYAFMDAKVNVYTVTFLDSDGTEWAVRYIEYGSAVTDVPAGPVKKGDVQYTYTFSKWDSDLSCVTGDMTVRPVYTGTLNVYTVTFLNAEGKTYKTVSVKYGSAVTNIPTGPVKKGDVQYTYTFSKWDSDLSCVTGNMTVRPVYTSTVNQYTVTFTDYDRKILKSVKVDYGSSVEAPEVPDKVTPQCTYTFIAWDDDGYLNVTCDMEIRALYSEKTNTFTVTFYDRNQKTIGSPITVEYGKGVTLPYVPEKEVIGALTYTFKGWSTDISVFVPANLNAVTCDVKVYAYYTVEDTMVTVCFCDDNGKFLFNRTVKYGTDLSGTSGPIRPASIQYSYEFIGWDKDLTCVTEDMTVYAVYDKSFMLYTVTFVDYNGRTVFRDVVPYGGSAIAPEAPVKPSDRVYDYVFSGWDGNYERVTRDVVVKATYEPVFIEYAVHFIVEGKEYAVKYVHYGETLTDLPEDPVKEKTAQYSYSFKGWSNSESTFVEYGFENITSETYVYAHFDEEVNRYTVKFYRENGNFYTYRTVKYGSSAEGIKAPEKESTAEYSYGFRGWSLSKDGYIEADLKHVTADMEVYAAYTGVKNQYTVTFKDWDGTLLGTSTVDYGTSATAPADPVREKTAQYSYTFAEWDKDYSCVTADMDTVAVYKATVNVYTVTFLDDDGKVLKTEKVEYGKAATSPGSPIKEPTAQYTYAFAGWNSSFDHIVKDTVVIATYIAMLNEYTVTFLVGSEIVGTKVLPYGTIIDSTGIDNPVPPAGMVFKGWNGVGTTVIGDTTVKAMFADDTETLYTVTYMDGDEKVHEEKVTYGQPSPYTGTPSKESTAQYTYVFKGWSSDKDAFVPADLERITKDVTVYAFYDYTVNVYTVVFSDYDGKILKTEKVEYDKSATAPKDPVREKTAQYTYTFEKWDTSFEFIVEDTVVKAVYKETVNTYSVSFMDRTTVISTIGVEYGKSATAPEVPATKWTPEHTFTFRGWSDSPDVYVMSDMSDIRYDRVFYAFYDKTVNSYTVTFEDDDGTVLKTEKVEYGKSATAPEDPVKEKTAEHTYSFKEWDVSFSYIVEDTVVKAVYSVTVNVYTVVFMDENVLKTEKVEYGKAATAPEDPVKEPTARYFFGFMGWSSSSSEFTEIDLTCIVGDVTAYAYYTKTLRMYDVTFMSDTGEEIAVFETGYGMPSEVPETPVKEPTAQYSYTFKGWSTSMDVYSPADLGLITGDTVVYAWFDRTVNSYDAIFTVDGEEYARKTLEYGAVIDASGVDDPAAPEGMLFKGWNGIGANIVKNTVLNAVFVYDDETLYSVVYIDGDTVLFTDKVTYGMDSTYAGTPVRIPTTQYTYSFKGWSSDKDIYVPAVLTGITSDTTVYAWFDSVVNTYTVKFYDDDGTLLGTDTVDYGKAATAPGSPTKEPTAQYTYVFAGWDTDFACVVSDIETVATYTSVVNVYTVTFLVGSETWYTEELPYGTTVTSENVPVPEAPVGTMFKGWDGVGTVVTSDVAVTAVFVKDDVTVYTVRYIDDDGLVITEIYRHYGEPAGYDRIPVKSDTPQYSYTFRGWSTSSEEYCEADLSCITEDITVYAWYVSTVRTYDVSFLDENGHLLDKVTVEYGSGAETTVTPVKESTVEYAYTFVGWSSEHGTFVKADLSYITNDTVVYSAFVPSIREYTVSYYSQGTLFTTRSVPYNGNVPTDVGTPKAPEGMLFDRWDGSEKTVVSDMSVTAVFTELVVSFKVTYLSEDGNVVWTEIVDAGQPATYSGTPVKEDTKQYTYTFVGWDKDLSAIYGNVTTSPVFEKTLREYTVLFLDWDRTVIHQTSVGYGYSVTDLPEDPVKKPTVQYVYTFKGWSDSPSQYIGSDLDEITGSTTVYAYYIKEDREYTVEFYDGDTRLGETYVPYQGTVEDDIAFGLVEGYCMKYYLDRELTKAAGPNYQILGDTVFYVEKYIGNYSMSGTNVTVSLDETMVMHLKDRFVIDISQISTVKTVTVDSDTVVLLKNIQGGCEAVFRLARGTFTVDSEDLYRLSAGITVGLFDDNTDGKDITVNISVGRVTAAITKAMGGRYYTEVYYVTAIAGSAVVTDLSVYGIVVEISLPLSLSEGRDDAAVWHIGTGNVVEDVDCSYSDNMVTFRTQSLGNFCVGTLNAPETKDKVIVPYGEAEVNKDGTLVSMEIDNHGEILFVPSYLGDVKVTSIAAGAFGKVTGATIMVIPQTVKTFDWSSLEGSSVLEVRFLGNIPDMKGTAPEGITVYRASDASGWDDHYAEVFEVFTRELDTCSLEFYIVGDYAVVKSWKSGNNINIPAYIAYGGKNVKVRYIGDSAFANNTYVSQVIVPDSVTDIMTRAFYNSWVKRIVTGDSPSIEHIWDGAFTGCNRLTNVSLPDTMLFIGDYAFKGCSLFTRITVPDTVQVIGKYAFAECTDLQKISLGSSLLYISEGCFYGDRQLDSVTLPYTVEYVEDLAFYNCISLPSIDLKNCTTVGADAFRGCNVLEYAVFGEGLASLGEGSFKDCPRLSEVDAYGAVPTGMDKAFDDTSAIEFYVTAKHLGEWSSRYNAELMESEKSYEEDKGDGMLYVIIGMIVVMFAIGVVSLRIRRNR